MNRTPLKINALSIAKMMRSLLEGPATAAELVAVSGLSRGTVYSYLKALHAEKCIYVCGWEKSVLNRDAIKIFAIGSKPDAPRTRKSKALIAAECRARKRIKILKDLGSSVTTSTKKCVLQHQQAAYA
jgi:hypothetical protein